MDGETKKGTRPKWYKAGIAVYVVFVVLFFGWLGWMVLTGEQEGPIPQKYEPGIFIGFMAVVAGVVVITIMELALRIIRFFTEKR